jgi:hypothetical protein
MKQNPVHRLRRIVIASLLLLGLAYFGVTTLKASPRNCSAATLQGKYGSLEQGTVIVDLGPPFPAPPWPVALTAIDTYDGRGNVSGRYWASFGGIPVSGTLTGTYTVYPDCTYSDTITPAGEPASHRVGTITGDGMGQELHTIYTDAWLVAFGTARRGPPWACSLSTLKGTYEVFGEGTDTSMTIPIPGFPSPPFPAAHVGVFTADGTGHFSGKDFEKVDVVTAPTTFTATYTVNPDCTMSSTITDSTGLVIHETGTITGSGESQEVHKIFTDPGWVFVDTVKKLTTR